MNESDLLSRNIACLIAYRSSCAGISGMSNGTPGPAGQPGITVSNFNLLGPGGIILNSGTSVSLDTKMNAGGWYGVASDVAYPNGFSLSFSTPTTNSTICVGVTDDINVTLGSSEYLGTGEPEGLNYAFKILPTSNTNGNSGNVSIIPSPGSNLRHTTYQYNNNNNVSEFYIEYDGQYMRYFIDGDLILCTNITTQQNLYLAILIYSDLYIDGFGETVVAPAMIDNIKFNPMGIAGRSDTLNWTLYNSLNYQNKWGIVINPSSLTKSSWSGTEGEYDAGFYTTIPYVGAVTLSFKIGNTSPFYIGLTTAINALISDLQFGLGWATLKGQEIGIYNNGTPYSDANVPFM